MRKRLVKTRKRIKKNIGGDKKGRAVCEKKNKSSDDADVTVKGGPLVLYERGEIEGYAVECEELSYDRETTEADAAALENADKGREGILRLVCGFVVVFSLFSAVVITCFAFAVATKYRDEPTEEVIVDIPNDNGALQLPDATEGKVLEAHEIYEKCASATVSVSVEYPDAAGGAESVGSGFVISGDGYIATASHVVEGAETITVLLLNGEKYEARVVAADIRSDVALLKIDGAEGLVSVELGSSAALRAGERVYAIGTPTALEYAGTMTSGEVSCPERKLPVYGEGIKTLEKKLRVIQMSTEVNKGSSGCPLIDSRGRVVGMVTMRLGGDVRGIGFALPIDGVSVILSAMAEGKELSNSLLSGVVLQPARLHIRCVSAEYNGAYGCRIEATERTGALKVGDVILQIDESLVARPSDIERILESKSPGESIRVTLIRSGQRLSFDIILGD